MFSIPVKGHFPVLFRGTIGGVGDEISERIAELIRLTGLRQAELGRRLNRARSAISEWKAGRSEPRLREVAKLCELAGVSADYLLGLTDDQAPRQVGENDLPVDPERLAEEAAEQEIGHELVELLDAAITKVVSVREQHRRAGKPYPNGELIRDVLRETIRRRSGRREK